MARYGVVAPVRNGGQAQYIERPVREDAGTSTDARFRQEAGPSPAARLTSARLKHARRLLESAELPVDDIVVRAGPGNGTNPRQHMRDTLDTTPSAYRRTFRFSPTAQGPVLVESHNGARR
ncbi:helix-turn-helix domain-containing protein [Streptomyces sp. NPDC050560]|uniref:helix-turn-helix domain-containing protein n=1 Tax=Streptomyces sp. NPDC050560 TaxID=3365630 RepID=UPI00378CD632